MTPTTTTIDVSVAAPELVMTRTFDAPRELVWTAFTTPSLVQQWYGGKGFENPVCEMDVRPGGLWKHVMRTPDGSEFAMAFVFVEVVRPEKLVWQHLDHDKPRAGGPPPCTEGPPTCRMTVTLAAAGQKTHWKLVARFSSPAERDFAMKMGFASTLAEGCDKFEAVARGLLKG